MIRKLLVSSIATATALAAAPAALAQNGQQAIEEIQVTSTLRKSAGLADVNAAVSVLGEQELDLINHTHLQESLNRLPGVSIHRNNGQESLVAIRSAVMTGAGACGAFLVAENSIPVRSAGFCNVNEMFDTHSENASSIEVVRGPGSAFWGSNAIHGLINVVLPKAGDVGEIMLEQGPRGSKRIRGSFGKDYGNFKQLLMVNGTDEEGYRDDSGVDQQKVSWLYNYTTKNGATLDGGFTMINLNQETAGYVTGTNSYADSALRATNPNPEAYRDSVNGRVWTTITQQVNDWELVLTPYFREVNMNFMQHFLPGQPIEDTEQRSLGLQLAAYRTLDNGAEFAMGLDLEDTSGSLKQTQPNPTTGSFFLRNSIPQGKHYDYDVDIQQVAGFVNYEQDLGSGWGISLGLRLENMGYEYDNKMIDGRTDEFGVACRFGCRYNRPADRDDSFTNLSPKLGLSYALNDNHDLQFRVQQGFRAPQATELYRLQNSQTVASLDSVELDSYEISVKGVGDNWNYSASWYFMDKENEILTNSARENLNDSHTAHRGIEFAMGYDISDTLSVQGVVNLAKHTYEKSQLSGGIDINGNDIDTAPNTFGNLRLQWRPTSAILSEVEWVNMGDYYTNPENTADYEGHDILNWRTQYQVNDDLSFYVNVLNVTDEKYAERADWTTFNGDRYFPGQPVRAFFGVTWNYK
ncbi:MAG: TonB-dependent receptor [Gammaproteobacteria bacterium]|nr:TonB-dependent receptor [Gammaproteobacteria bacterium]MDG2339420.1 TonB-dependent receptor [Gammaproteobacteria bacterium]